MITAKVIAKTTVNNEPAELGTVVEVDENTFANLARKGRLEAAEPAAAPADEAGDGESATENSPRKKSKK